MFDDDVLLFAKENNLEDRTRKYNEKWKVMIVDDEEEIHHVTKLVLDDFEFDGKRLDFLSAYSGEEAKRLIAENSDVAVILLDVVMDEDTGLKVVKFIRQELKNKLVRIILRTDQPGQVPEIKAIVDYDINDCKEKTELTSQKLFTTMVSCIRSYRDITTIDQNKNIYLNKEVESTQEEVIFTLGGIAEARSKETGYHVKRVAEYSRILAIKYGMSEEEAELVRLASPMHDIGKLAIPDEILNKPGKLTYEEFEVIKTHSVLGYDMLRNSDKEIMKAAATIALEHHEKFDGTGYPIGLRGDNIHIYGRITAVADVFDSLGSDRVYKKAWPLNDILKLFREEKGRHFDPVLVDILFENLEEFLLIKNSLVDID